MKVLNGNPRLATRARSVAGTPADGALGFSGTQRFLRVTKKSSADGKTAAQKSQPDHRRIKALEAELAHYRYHIDQMAAQRTEKLNLRISILESCNSNLGESYHKMHQMYLELLIKIAEK